VIVTYKYRLKPQGAVRALKRYARACNFVWNFCVETHKRTVRGWREGEPRHWLSFYELKTLCAGTSTTLEVGAGTIQNVVEQFIKARDNFKKCPRFRSKKSLGWVPFQSQEFGHSVDSVTYRKKKYRFFGAKRRHLPEKTRDGMFVEDASGKWYVCVRVDVKQEPRASEGSVGIDLGLKSFVALSTGEKIAAPQFYRQYEERLGTAQRAGHKNRVRKINAKIRDCRADFLHKLSTSLVRRYDQIFVGDVSPSRLAKTTLAKSVYDAGWSMFREQLRYKASRHGVLFAVVDERFTTQICSSCGENPETSPKGMIDLGMRQWECSSCGVTHNRDVNAAKNILTVGLSTQPPVEGSRTTTGTIHHYP